MGINLLYYFYLVFPKNILTEYYDKNYYLINIDSTRNNNFVDLFYVLSNSSFFLGNNLLDLFGVDFPMKTLRFQVNYYILSVLKNARYFIRVCLSKDDTLQSVVPVYKSAGWLEREVWDMYGIFFENNLDLRRILTDYGFEGFPLRKDYPLLGFFQVRFDMEASHVIYERVNVAQELRMFEYLSPWRV